MKRLMGADITDPLRAPLPSKREKRAWRMEWPSIYLQEADKNYWSQEQEETKSAPNFEFRRHHFSFTKKR